MDFVELDQNIIFEDEALLVLNKPAGWVVNRSTTYSGLTVQDWFATKNAKWQMINVKSIPNDENQRLNEYGTPEEIFQERGGIVHRLDKDTSGILLLAKTPTTLIELLRQFKAREIQKTYVALVHGKISPADGTIRLPMERSAGDFKKFAVSVDGKLSETQYHVIEFYPGRPEGISEKKGKGYQGFSLLELKPKTGRTHQIRVHLSALKHPIVADATYAGRKRIAVDKDWCPRQFLHAKAITFTHPMSKKEMTFEAPLAKDLEAVLELFT